MGYYLQITNNPNFVILLASFTIIEYSFFCYFIYLISRKKIKNFAIILWTSFLIFAAIDYFYINENQTFDSFASGIESIIIILLCVYYLFSQVRGSNDLLIYSTFNFWIVVTFLIYFSGTFFLYIMTYSMRENVSFQKQYFVINASFNILKNVLLSVAMCMKTKDSFNPTPSTVPDLDDELFYEINNN